MTIRPRAITFSCRDPHKVADFWADALGRNIAAMSDSGSAAILADIPLYFRQAEGPESESAHLDLSSDDMDADASRLRELGATQLCRTQWHSTESITFIDVEGNTFDVIGE